MTAGKRENNGLFTEAEKGRKKPEKRRSKTASGEGIRLMERGTAALSHYHFSVLKSQAHGSAALLLQRVKVPEVAGEGARGHFSELK